ncbi:nitroreductase [Desulfuromonas versatilis]|uniref:Nitroreductase n=1 Tax=Desulfuromonas versatilis TaxID=2802975 RepID=A0ABN6DWS8_9BACT|nr:nitroreductase family protein [Desulfuromonas versatilis]BCR04562.1 nitroreductase [Desulfuromonas versatilis]
MLPMLLKRRSTRRFTNQQVDRQQIDQLIEAALRSPSSRGRNPWEFVVVSEPETLAQLARAKQHGSDFLKGAPLAIVVVADPERSDVWVEDCAIASILIQLTAQSIGLASCWVQIRERQHNEELDSEQYLRNLLGLPERYRVLSVIGIGHPDEFKQGHPKSSLEMEKIHYGRYGGKNS